jgi:hypothetical protein
MWATDSGKRCRAAGPESKRAERVFHQASSIGLMVLGEPLPILARTFSMVGRSPSRSRESAAWETSDWVMPRGGGRNRKMDVVCPVQSCIELYSVCIVHYYQRID